MSTAPPADDALRIDGRSYVHVGVCDGCGAAARALYGAAEEPALHPIQVRCDACGLVFATPRLTPAALEELYRTYFSELATHHEDEGDARRRRAGIARLLGEIAALEPGRRLLDVGAGSGDLLAAARDRGYDAAGVELSAEGVERARARHGLETVLGGTFEEAPLAGAAFDVVVAWHVVEHVFDLGAFVRRAHEVLRPGGLLVVGTESYRYPTNSALRAARFASGRVPRPVTSPMHTFVFSPASLRSSVERHGFTTLSVRAYDELTLRERVLGAGATTELRRRATQATALVGGTLDRLLRTGPFLAAFFRSAS